MDHFQDVVEKIAVPGSIVQRLYGNTVEGHCYCIIIYRVMWYHVMTAIELNADENKYKIAQISQHLTKNEAQSQAKKIEKIKTSDRELAEIMSKGEIQTIE